MSVYRNRKQNENKKIKCQLFYLNNWEEKKEELLAKLKWNSINEGAQVRKPLFHIEQKVKSVSHLTSESINYKKVYKPWTESSKYLRSNIKTTTI